MNALVTARHGLLIRYEKQIADLAIKHRLPSMFEATDTADAGGLMSYSASDADSFRRAAVFVDKILKGAKPADLPVEAADQVRVRHQSQNRQADRRDNPTGSLGAGESDNSVKRG